MSTPVAAPKPKSKKKRVYKPRPPPKGVSFKSRGPHKCVRMDGTPLTGLHHKLDRVLGKIDYTAWKASGALRELPMPQPSVPVVHHERDREPTRAGPPSNAVKAGSKLDAQVSLRVYGAFRRTTGPIHARRGARQSGDRAVRP